MSRNLAFIATLMDSNVEFIAADNPHANRLTVHILSAVAEHECGAISERTKAALAPAKRRGVKLGGPRLAAARKSSIKARSEAADAFASARQAASAACAASPARWPPAASRPPVVVIGATCRSPPSCGARRQHATPRPVVRESRLGTWDAAMRGDPTAAGLRHGVVAAALGRCPKDIRCPETVRGRAGMPSVA